MAWFSLYDLRVIICRHRPDDSVTEATKATKWTPQKQPMMDSAELAEQRSIPVINEFGHDQWRVALDAHTADAQRMPENAAPRAATEADEEFAATGAMRNGVCAQFGRLRVTSG